MKSDKPPKPREVQLPHHSYQPSKAELEQDHRVDATFDEIVSACLKPVKIKYVMPQSRKP